jgi:hypothetical protein
MFTIFDPSTADLARARSQRRPKASPAETLYRELEAHRDSQAAILHETDRAAEWAATPLASYLLRLIRDSESAQAGVLDRMSASLRDALYWTSSAEGLPDGTDTAEREETVRSLRQLLKLERQRARTARRLAKAYAGIDGGLEQALLEASAAASESNSRLVQLMLKRFTATSQGVKVASPRLPRATRDKQRLAA